ncbi:thiamine pyrophosphate-binding protein [Novosphingobium sp. 9U]|uniref:thiamine pyrophosphate-binding protein n=1 Tax=Novosphingobium sp. 9U TaxID=2653158 RepID=UPI001356BB66|nr:thiamine pyrophosphate-binding protein [Novosphingobium sp. 9U]
MTETAASTDTAQTTVGALIAQLLAHWGVSHAFGVISIHNMPILDPLGEQGAIRYISARGEAGALNMADAHARVTGNLGVAFTSTGTAAGNAAGAMVEALTAGSPVMHITGQVELEHLDRNRAYIHEAPAQMQMLGAVSKAAFRITSPDQVIETMLAAAEAALSTPTGPVSIEIPVDVQAAPMAMPAVLPLLSPKRPETDAALIAALGEMLAKAKKPVILLGGGARGAEAEATALADKGIAIVTSTNGRGVIVETHPMSLGAFNCTREVQGLYDEADLMIVAGSRLRGNETWTYKLRLPSKVAVIDADATSDGRSYANELFIHGDVKATLAGLLDALGETTYDTAWGATIAAARAAMHGAMRQSLGAYAQLVDEIQARLPADAAWVRDVTISNSMWGNRFLRIGNTRAGVHAVGGGIGQGLPMAIGAAFGTPGGAIALSGDGGLTLCLGELATLAEEDPDVTLVLMNDKGYGVIRNIQDVEYGGRRHYSNIRVPDFAMVAASIGLRHEKVTEIAQVGAALDRARSKPGAAIVEIDMLAIGAYPQAFAGPPRKA